MRRLFLVSLLWTVLHSEALAADDPKGIDFFEKNIRPVLVAKCYQCHSATSKELKGELRLDTREGLRKGGESGLVVVPGKPEESPLIKALRHEEGLEMPPKEKLPDSVVANFVKWVEIGAPDPRKPNVTTVGDKINLTEARKFWAFQPPKVVPPTVVKNAAWAKSDIDRYLLAALEAKNLAPVADAERATLIRRAYFDLIGLPPTPEAIDEFVRADHSPHTTHHSPDAAYEALIDRLLAMPQFGERWGRHWLDVARYGESSSKERNIPYPYAWKYRDYVYDSVAADKPFDQFVREQIAGDVLPAKNDKQRNEMLTATGFLTLGPKSLNTRNVEQFRMDVADEQLDVATRGVLALSVACARCHDHKFDPIPTADYYSMVGIFRSTEVLGGVKAGNNKTGYSGEYAYLTSAKKRSGASAEDRRRLAELKTELENAQENMQQIRVAAKEALASQPDRQEKKGKAAKAGKKAKLADNLPPKFQQAFKKGQQRIAEINDEIQSLESKSGGAGGEPVMAVRDSAMPEDCRINIRGEVNDLGDTAPRGFVKVLTYPHSPDVNFKQSGRLQLALWMTSKQNPLTARVMANRVWFHLFGRGIVPTVDNFGALGEPPTNQPLLDYLAVRLMDSGWSMKKLIRQVMLSRAYQLASDHSDANYAADPDNTLVWRMNRRRLDAEAIRDAVLFVGGSLDLARPHGSPTQSIEGEIGRRAKTDELLKEVTYRSAYLPIVRGMVPEFLSLFDVADPELVTGQRDVTTIAPQALYMMNNPVVLQQAEKVANNLLADSRLADDAARVDYAFRLMLGRPADTGQRAAVLSFLQTYEQSLPSGMKAEQRRAEAWTSACQTLLASAEFRYVY
jgi:cytochrome c553